MHLSAMQLCIRGYAWISSIDLDSHAFTVRGSEGVFFMGDGRVFQMTLSDYVERKENALLAFGCD